MSDNQEDDHQQRLRKVHMPQITTRSQREIGVMCSMINFWQEDEQSMQGTMYWLQRTRTGIMCGSSSDWSLNTFAANCITILVNMMTFRMLHHFSLAGKAQYWLFCKYFSTCMYEVLLQFMMAFLMQAVYAKSAKKRFSLNSSYQMMKCQEEAYY